MCSTELGTCSFAGASSFLKDVFRIEKNIELETLYTYPIQQSSLILIYLEEDKSLVVLFHWTFIMCMYIYIIYLTAGLGWAQN